MRINGKIIWALALTATLGRLAAQRPQGGARDARTQTILLHDLAGVPADVLSGAKAEVARILSRANVGVEWLGCSSVPDEAGKLKPCPARPAGTIILRVVPATLEFVDKAALGYALLTEQNSVYATVSYTRVQQCAKRQAKSAASLEQVLGHAMAHELGHILLGTGSHSSAGLMRGNWDATQLDDAAKGRLHFSRDEARHIQDAVARRVRDEGAQGQVVGADSRR